MQTAICRSAGFEPRKGFTSDDYNVVQGLVAANVAISLLPEMALSNLRDDIVIKPIEPKTPKRRVLAATLAGGFRSPAMAAMLDVLGGVAERLRLPPAAARAGRELTAQGRTRAGRSERARAPGAFDRAVGALAHQDQALLGAVGRDDEAPTRRELLLERGGTPPAGSAAATLIAS